MVAPTSRLYVSGGFAEVTPERCTVLADEAIPVAEVSRKTAEAQAGRSRSAAYAAADKLDIPALDAADGSGSRPPGR